MKEQPNQFEATESVVEEEKTDEVDVETSIQKEETERPPIKEDETSVSYLGVKLEKAQNKEGFFVPQKEKYQDYINDRFSLELQQKIAISLAQGDPLLVESGTSIGKTTAIKKMASELGWEVHYANLNGATDVEDLMGRYIPNPNKTKPEDPEYIFADGKVTSGLRQEEGKKKIIILDEINAAPPNILIRLHEVLDALERDSEVVLSEDASETVATNKTNTKIISLMNPPGKGYLGRKPLDPAQLRRWVYQKEVTDLPKETFSHSTDALFSLADNTQDISKEAFLDSPKQALSPEELTNIPGMQEILEKYKEFHTAAKEMLKQRKIAEDQPQQFSFDDRMEPKRVRDFVLRFYTGDINETFQEALRYYYSGKLESDEDKKELEELIRQIEYVPETESKRKSIEGEENAEDTGTAEQTAEQREEQKKEALEKKSLEYMEDLWKRGADKNSVVKGLTGFDSDKAWDMRERLINEWADKDAVVLSLAGLDSDKAWDMREKLVKAGAKQENVIRGLVGLDSKKSWYRREKFFERGINKEYIAQSLAGLDSDKAWDMRDRLLKEGMNKNAIVLGLAGVNSDKAWDMRERLVKKKFFQEEANKNFVAQSLAGLDSDKAWDMRDRLLLFKKGASKDAIAKSLAGVNSNKAWDMRERLLDGGADKDTVAESLAGVNSNKAWDMRERLLDEGASKDAIALGLARNYTTCLPISFYN